MTRITGRRTASLVWLAAFLLADCNPRLPTGAAGVAASPSRTARSTNAPDARAGEAESADTQFHAEDPFEGVDLRFNPDYWELTDFEAHSVPYSEIRSGGPPPDGIPPIDDPQFESVEAAGRWLGDDWPVIFLELSDEARAYPLAILIWHEIANDVIAGEPVAVTFCPLCNASIVFSRTLADGRVLDFGTTGNLRRSDLVMYDRQTESWWQQFTGEAIVGNLTGEQLALIPSQIIPFSTFAREHPGAAVLSRETGHTRPYGQNPYSGYDSISSSPFLFDGEADDRLPPMARVVAVESPGERAAYPFSELSEVGVVNDELGGEPIVVFWRSGTRSAFGFSTDDTGSTGVFSRHIGGQVLTFRAEEAGFEDQETGSTWNLLGEASAGPLSGEALEPLISGEYFWFAWAAFRPDTRIWSPE
jgi:hypothetical protein